MFKRKLAPELSFLNSLADSFCDKLAEGGDGFLIHLASVGGDGCDVGTKPLEGRHPADVLVGTVAPDDWWALGVAVGGWARSIDAKGTPGERAGRVANVVVVTREGHIVSRLRMGGKTLTDQPTHGAILDCLQRAFELPTAPPAARTGQLLASMWLEAVISSSATEREAGGKPLRWPDVCRLHPVFRLLGADGDGYRLDDLERAALVLERVCDWERLRWLVVEGRWPAANMTGTEAAWLDTGAFSRWILGDRLTLAGLLDEVDHAAGTGTARRCFRTLQRLGLLARNEWHPAT